MATLPNSQRAYVDPIKLRDYCLNPEHPEGRHKARVFAAALGLTAADWPWLRDALLEAATAAEAEEIGRDEFGCRYAVEAKLVRGGKTAAVRSVWMLRAGEDFPRLVTCYVV